MSPLGPVGTETSPMRNCSTVPASALSPMTTRVDTPRATRRASADKVGSTEFPLRQSMGRRLATPAPLRSRLATPSPWAASVSAGKGSAAPPSSGSMPSGSEPVMASPDFGARFVAAARLLWARLSTVGPLASAAAKRAS